MTRYIKGKDGKFAGSIGDGKHTIPTPSDVVPDSVRPDDSADQQSPDYAEMRGSVPLTEAEITARYNAAANDPVALVNLVLSERRLGFRGYRLLSGAGETTAYSAADGDRLIAERRDGSILATIHTKQGPAQVSIRKEVLFGANTRVATADGTEYRLMDNRLNYTNGPAVTHFDGTQEYWRRGKHRCTITPDGRTLEPGGAELRSFPAWLRRHF